MMQEPKYQFVENGVRNRASGEIIPDDEPVMVFRARDWHALAMIEFYLGLVQTPEHREAVRQRLEDFRRFKAEHPERMKEPDTELR